jgi:tetratricopeptide (TPR) repeat protein
MKLGNWDPLLLQLFMDRMRDRVSLLSDPEKEALCMAIDKVWDHFYPVSSEKGEFAAALGEWLFAMEQYSQAIAYFERSLEITGYRPDTYLKMGASYLAMQDKDSAWACYRLAKIGSPDE